MGQALPATAYYRGREAELAELFGDEVAIDDDAIVVGGRRWPVVHDVIVTLPSDRLPPRAAALLGVDASRSAGAEYAPEIQSTFGEEWHEHQDVLAEHEAEFDRYFDLVDLDGLADRRVADLGCGSGRWASFVAPRCRSLAVVDFSDAVFVARENLRAHENVVFVLGDVLALPFPDDAFDLAYCIGVLHHLPVDALEATRRLARLAPEVLVYLYYALDNRPAYYRLLLGAVSVVRRRLAKVRGARARSAITWVLTALVYLPLAGLGAVVPRGWRRFVPLADTYTGMSVRRIRQDVYDRFFTGIEQRVSRAQIATLHDTFASVTVSDGLPYWHFLCRR
jgi:SAM-dependent methyltransferase